MAGFVARLMPRIDCRLHNRFVHLDDVELIQDGVQYGLLVRAGKLATTQFHVGDKADGWHVVAG